MTRQELELAIYQMYPGAKSVHLYMSKDVTSVTVEYETTANQNKEETEETNG